MKTDKLPRGIRRRGDSLVVSFALADGRIERRALGPVSVSYAVEQRAIYQRQVREGNYQKRVPRPKEKPFTLADVWAEYLRAYKLAGKKAAWRQTAAWKHLSPTFETMRPEQIATADLTAYQEARIAAGAAHATVNRELAALRASLFHAHGTTGANGLPVLDRVPNFPAKLKEAKPRPGFIEASQYATLAANAKPLWLRTFLACAYSFAFRRGELLGMRVQQVDFFGRWMELYDSKSGEARKIKMTGEVYNLMLEATRGKNPDDFVFTRENGEHVVDPRKSWAALCAASDCAGLLIHDLRRSAIRNMVRAGIPETVCMKISGHKTRHIFDAYNLSSERDLIAATEKIELTGQVSAPGTGTDTKTSTLAISPENAHTRKRA